MSHNTTTFVTVSFNLNVQNSVKYRIAGDSTATSTILLLPVIYTAKSHINLVKAFELVSELCDD